MILALIAALLLGVLSGTITGLTPGIHINLIAVMVISFTDSLLQFFSPLGLAVFIIAMSLTHTFVDFIPSIFLGAPDEDSILSVLPGHQLLLQGRGYFAVIYTLYGGLVALGLILFFTPVFIVFLPKIYTIIQSYIGILLIIVLVYLLILEKEKKTASLIIFLLAGALGIATLNLNIKEPLLPLLTGLFGASGLLISITEKTKLPEQSIVSLSQIRLTKKSYIKGILASIIAVPFTAFLPGLGASQAAIIGQQSLHIEDQREFLFLIGTINTLVMGLSFITLYTIKKTRTGSAVAVLKLLEEFSPAIITITLITIILTGIIAFIIAVILSKIIAIRIDGINYQKLSGIIFVVLIGTTALFADNTFEGKLLGLLVFAIATILGITAIHNRVKRNHLMGCLLVPTILYYMV